MISASLVVECLSLHKVRIIFKWISAGNSLVFFFFFFWQRGEEWTFWKIFFPFHSFIVILKTSERKITQQQQHNKSKKKTEKKNSANVDSFVNNTVQQIFSLKKLKNKQVCFRVICGH